MNHSVDIDRSRIPVVVEIGLILHVVLVDKVCHVRVPPVELTVQSSQVTLIFLVSWIVRPIVDGLQL